MVNIKIHYVSISPAFKTNSISTPCRIAYNLAKKDKESKKSQNDISLTGLVQLDMTKTGRFFKSRKGMAAADVKKFYNQILVSKEDFNRQLFVWRFEGDPNNPLETYIFTRIMFGHVASSFIAKVGLQKICYFGESL